MSAQIDPLLERVHAMCADPFFRDVVRRHCGYLPKELTADALNLTIHPDDQMLLHSLRHHSDANAAFSQYFNVAMQQYHAFQQVLHGLFPGETDRVQVLDFACGYGRLLRFLSLSLPRSNLWAAEIQEDALSFVCERFGVQRIPSPGAPADFRPPRRFDLIWVASLFSHLPGHLFEAWLRRLLECLDEGGVLCFSVHDGCLLPADTPLPESGILFRPFSENAGLDAASYGTTHVSEHYVASIIARVCGADRPYLRIPRCLAHEQDLYLVPASTPGPDLSGLNAFRYGPWGWVDQRELGPDGQLCLRGWAASLDDGALPSVDVRLDDLHLRCPTGSPREDVGRFFSDPRLNKSGFLFRQTLAPGGGVVRSVVSAASERDGAALLYAGEMARSAAASRSGPEVEFGRLGLLRRLGDWLRSLAG